MKPGELLQEGIVVTHDESGVLVGRLAEVGEVRPRRHSEHVLGGRLVFLSDDQAPIPPAGLHPLKVATPAKAKAKAKARK